MSGDLDRELERLRAATEAITPEERLGDAVMLAVKGEAAEDPLASIARRTSGLDAAPEITDAILGRIQGLSIAAVSAEGRPEETAASKERSSAQRRDLVPQRQPRARTAPASWTEGVGRAGPFAIGLGLLAAAASFALFLSSQREVDQAIVSSVDTVEVLE